MSSRNTGISCQAFPGANLLSFAYIWFENQQIMLGRSQMQEARRDPTTIEGRDIPKGNFPCGHTVQHILFQLNNICSKIDLKIALSP